MATRLARLKLNQIQHLILATEDQIVEAPEDRRALPKRRARPPRLRGARFEHRTLHIVLLAAWHPPQRLARERLLDVHRLARRNHGDPGRQRVEAAPIDPRRTGRG